MHYSFCRSARRLATLLALTLVLLSGIASSATFAAGPELPASPAEVMAPVVAAATPNSDMAPPSAPAADVITIRIAAIEVTGNVSTPKEAVLAACGIKVGDEIPYDKLQETIQQSLNAIMGIGTVADPRASMEQFRNGMTLYYRIQENPKVTGIDFAGNKLVPSVDLSPVVASAVGAVADRTLIKKDLESINKLYQERGYSLGDISVAMDEAGRLLYTVAEAEVHSIKIVGNTKTQEYVVRRELLSKVGEPVDTNKIRTELRRIYNLGSFSEVTPKLEPGEKANLVEYTIELKEQKTGRFGGGITYAVSEGVMGNLTIEEPNLFGRGQGLNLNVEAGLKGSHTLEFAFREPRLSGSRTSMDLRIFNKDTRQRDYAVMTPATYYVEHRTGGEALFGIPLAEDDRLSVGVGSEYTLNFTEERDPYPLAGEGRTNYVDLGYTRDTRDNYLDSKSGYRLTLSGRGAGGILGGDNQFVRYQGAFSTYKKLPNDYVLAFRASAGQVRFSGDLPAQEEFRLGGTESIRGQAYGALRGDTMMFSNLELRIPVQKPTAATVVAFVDVGDAWSESLGQTMDDLKVGVGVGARIGTPLGPIRLDYGWGKDADTGTLKGKVHFSFGQTF